MASVPRKRKNELLKNYYDGDTVGRAAVNRYLDMQRGVNPAINANELMFLGELWGKTYGDGEKHSRTHFIKCFTILTPQRL